MNKQQIKYALREAAEDKDPFMYLEDGALYFAYEYEDALI
jgi:hypothetical protein